MLVTNELWLENRSVTTTWTFGSTLAKFAFGA